MTLGELIDELSRHDPKKLLKRGHVVRETPRLVDQRPTGLGFFELRFEAETGKR